MTTFKSLRPVALAVTILCLVTALAIAAYSPAGSVSGPAPDAPDTKKDTSAPQADSKPAPLVVCPIDRCPDESGAGTGPDKKPDGAGQDPPCALPGSCPRQQPPDRVHCLAIGCPTGDENERPVSSDEPGGARRPDSAPARDLPGGAPVNSFAECVSAGYPVAESYPEQCISPYGTFTRPTS